MNLNLSFKLYNKFKDPRCKLRVISVCINKCGDIEEKGEGINDDCGHDYRLLFSVLYCICIGFHFSVKLHSDSQQM